MTHPSILALVRSCAKWRNGAILVATLALIGSTYPIAPGRVTDLAALPVTDTSLVLTWTEVSTNSTSSSYGRYAIKMGPTGTYDWATAPYVATGGCKWPVIGSSAGGGRVRSCILGSLTGGRAYSAQVVQFTGSNPATTSTIGLPSNIAMNTTGERIGPMIVLRGPVSLDSVAVRAVEISDWPSVRWPLKGSFQLGDRRATFYDSAGVATVLGYLLVTRP